MDAGTDWCRKWTDLGASALVALAASGCSVLLRSDDADFRGGDAPTCDFLGEPTYLKAPEPTRSGFFGTLLAASGDTLVVNAVMESPFAVRERGEVDGQFCPGKDQNDVPPLGAGAIYVYDRGARDEAPAARLTHKDDSPHILPTDELMGFLLDAIIPTHPVAVNQSWLAIGGAGDANFSGSVRLYRRDGGSTDARGEPALSLPGKKDESGMFGFGVALDGDLLVVGASRMDGVTAPNSGAAFVYELDGTRPTAHAREVAKLQPPDLRENGGFGSVIAVSGEWIVIGAPGESGADPGVVYAFRRDDEPLGANPQAIPAPEDTGLFGAALALDDDWLAIGAPGTPQSFAGSAHLYRAGPKGWEHVQPLRDEREGGLLFGWALAFLPDQLLVSHAGSAHGRPASLEGLRGAMQGFQRHQSGVRLDPCILHAPNPDPCDGFSVGLAVGDRFVAIGAQLEDGERGGIGEPDFDNGLKNAGAVYVYPRK